jgi:hypothetical protein
VRATPANTVFSRIGPFERRADVGNDMRPLVQPFDRHIPIQRGHGSIERICVVLNANVFPISVSQEFSELRS